MMWDGFARFCRTELQTAPETVIGAHFAPMLARLVGQRERLEAAEPDPAEVDEYTRGLTEGWRRVLGLETRGGESSDAEPRSGG